MQTKDSDMTATDPMALLGSGAWMNGFSEDIARALARCEELCFRLNSLAPSRLEERKALAKEIVGSIGDHFFLHSPFHCDLGTNVHIGDYFLGNFNLTILDEARVSIGDHVFIGPNCTLCTVVHALDAPQRNEGIMRTAPVTIEDNVWLAANVTVLPGVTIGTGSVIGAGSVVTKDVPPHTLAVGNPCKPLRAIGPVDNIAPASILQTI